MKVTLYSVKIFLSSEFQNLLFLCLSKLYYQRLLLLKLLPYKNIHEIKTYKNKKNK